MPDKEMSEKNIKEFLKREIEIDMGEIRSMFSKNIYTMTVEED